MASPRTVFLYSKTKYGSNEIDAVEYAKRYGEHMIAVRIKQWRAGTIKQDQFLQDLMDLAERNQDALVNTRTE